MKRVGLLLPIIAVGCGAAGFFAYRQWTSSTAEIKPVAASAANNTIEADAVPPKLVVPETVPDIKLKDLSGKTHALAEFKGAPTIYNFWATWCAPCRREIPLLNELQTANRADRLQIVGMAIDFRDDVQKFVATTPLNYSLLVGEEDGLDAAAKFGMEVVLPFSVFANSQGQIVAVKVGELHRNEANAILAGIRSLEAGKLTLETARLQISTRLHEISLERAAISSQK